MASETQVQPRPFPPGDAWPPDDTEESVPGFPPPPERPCPYARSVEIQTAYGVTLAAGTAPPLGEAL
jgi:hypothetical protein